MTDQAPAEAVATALATVRPPASRMSTATLSPSPGAVVAEPVTSGVRVASSAPSAGVAIAGAGGAVSTAKVRAAGPVAPAWETATV